MVGQEERYKSGKMNYIVFISNDCPYCDDTIDLLKSHNLNYKVVRFDYDQRYLLNEVKRSFDWPTVPIVIKREGDDIQFVGGYQDLTESLKEYE